MAGGGTRKEGDPDPLRPRTEGFLANHDLDEGHRPGPDRETIYRALTDGVDLARLPAPPASAAEWRERALHFCHDAPGLRTELSNLPVGWFALVERAMQEVHRLLPPGSFLRTRQVKEKYATLRWYSHVESPHEDPVPDTGADGAINWAEDMSAQVCALLGTSDGEADNQRGWWLTLSPAACRLRRDSDSDGGLNALMYPPWDD